MIVIKGDQVVLREKGTEGDLDAVGLRLPADYVLCHDPSGEYLRPCDFYICKARKVTIPGDRVNRNDEQVARLYYGNATKITPGEIDLPDGDWQRVCLVDQIGYRRRGDRSGQYQHPYATSVPLYECKGRTRAWRLRLPVSCVADERGFVTP